MVNVFFNVFLQSAYRQLVWIFVSMFNKDISLKQFFIYLYPTLGQFNIGFVKIVGSYSSFSTLWKKELYHHFS